MIRSEDKIWFYLLWIQRPLLLASLLLLMTSIEAQNVNKTIRQGNKEYGLSNFEAAEKKYQESLEIDSNSTKGMFNQGSAYYKQEKFEEAIKKFEMSAKMLDDPLLRARAYHNMGNTLFQTQDLPNSVEAYKNALRLNPMDEDTRYNLAVAQQQLQQQQEQQDSDSDQDQPENQDQQNSEDQQDQQDQNENEQGNQQDSEQQQNNSDQGEEEGSSPKPAQLSKEEVERILEALANDENKVQEKIIRNKTKAKKVKIEKDWLE